MLAALDRDGLRRVDAGYGDVWARVYRPRGLGQSQSAVTQQVEQLTTSGAVSVGGAAATAAVSGASVGAAAATAAIGFGIGAVALAIVAWAHRKGPAQKVASTKIANEIAPLLEQNLSAYQAGPHTRASQQVALQNFDSLWSYLGQACGNPQLGDPGKRCIRDRQQGSCAYHDAKGGCWNWFVGYRDPIANDPNVHDTPESTQTLSLLGQGALDFSQLFGSSSVLPWILGAGLVAVLVSL